MAPHPEITLDLMILSAAMAAGVRSIVTMMHVYFSFIVVKHI
jgi:hypothetical protein